MQVQLTSQSDLLLTRKRESAASARAEPPEEFCVSDRSTISLTPLAACLAAALFSLPVDARPLRSHASAFAFHAAPLGGVTLPVTSCLDDNSGGTLREMMAVAGEGDTLDMSALACSTITLAQGQLWTGSNINLLGPSDHELTIDAASASRAIFHYGGGTLGLSHLGIRNGLLLGTQGYGACIFSDGSVSADHVHIAHCINSALPGFGGGVFAYNSFAITDSSITGSDGGYGGGGVMADSGTIERSTISGNTARHAGGAYAVSGVMNIVDSTVSGNTATASGAGGIRAEYGLTIVNSTISGNTAVSFGGGIEFGSEASISNSTIVFNQAADGGGIRGFNGSTLAMTSSIVALNAAGPGNSDIGNVTSVDGSHNLIMVTGAAVPPDTLTGDPGIGVLANNGGPTQTHALLPASIAIDTGANPAALATDQRGFARSAGAATDIGAYELQPDSIFADGFELPGTHR
jgi:hypothetical protein